MTEPQYSAATYTYAYLDVSSATYEEVKTLLLQAGYDHQVNEDYISMHGLALRINKRMARVVLPEEEHESLADPNTRYDPGSFDV